MLQQVFACGLSLIGWLLLSCHLSMAQNFCYAPNNVAGECRSIYNCPHVLSQVQGQIQSVASEFLRSLHCDNGSGQYPYVCCAQQQQQQQQQTFNQFGGQYPQRPQRPQQPQYQQQPQRPQQPQYQQQPQYSPHHPQHQPPPPPPAQQQQPRSQSASTLRHVSTHLSPSTNHIRTNNNPSPVYQQHHQPHTPQYHQQQPTLDGSQLPGPGVCGLTSLAHRIFGGEETNLDDYSWIALLEYQPRNRRERKLSCGGSLINTRYILTAAHCLVGEIERRVGQLVGVRLGEFDLSKERDCQGNTCADPILVLGVEQKIAHEGYNEKNPNRANDIGLIRMDTEVTFTDYVRPVCLPSSVNSPRAVNNEKLVSAGWGRTEFSRQSKTKLEVELPLVSHRQCRNKFKELGISLSSDQLCAGGVYGYDTCDGDSGNPLMRLTAYGWIAEGIVSFGRGCGLDDFPAVYTKVANYDSWIRQNLRA